MCERLLQFIEHQLETREEVRALQTPIEACLPAHVTAMFCPLIEHQPKTGRVVTGTRREVFVEAGIEQHKQRGRAWHVAGVAALDLQSPADAWSQRHMPKTVNGHRAKPIVLGEGAHNLGPKAQALWTLHYLGEAFLMPELYTMARAFTAEPDRSVEDVEQDDVTLRTVGISVARTATVINDKAYGLPSPLGQVDSFDGRFTLMKDPIVVFCSDDVCLLTQSRINTASGTMVALMVGTTADKHAVRKDLLHFVVCMEVCCSDNFLNSSIRGRCIIVPPAATLPADAIGLWHVNTGSSTDDVVSLFQSWPTGVVLRAKTFWSVQFFFMHSG